MHASEIFARLSPTLASQVLTYLQESDKPAYRMAIQALAAQRKLRPIFVERKPRPERHAWMQAALGRPSGEQIAANFLQLWLMGAQSAMLCDFLDSLGIAHEENGAIDELPTCPQTPQLQAAVDALIAKHPPEAVAVYLHCFQAMDIAGWPALREILDHDERLRLGPAPIPVP
jgi:hypothetical protein